MDARSSRSVCSRQRASPAAARSPSFFDSFARMSDAAARVNVTTSMRSTSAPSSSTSRSTRSTSTVVLPEPAAALRSRFSPRASMALSCSSVHLGAFAISLPRFRLSLKPMIPHFPALDKPRPGSA